MLRREILASGVASASLVVGCTGQSGLASAPSTERETTTTRSRNKRIWAPQRSISIGDIAQVPSDAPISFDATVGRWESTPSRPPTVEVVATNETNREHYLYCGQRPVFATQRSQERGPGLALVTPGRGDEHTQFGCWRLTDAIGYPRQTPMTSRLQPEESVSVTLQVWGGPETDAGTCLPTGTYTFVETYNAWPAGDEQDLNLDSPDFECQLEIQIYTNSNYKWFATNATTASGDSGGPLFRPSGTNEFKTAGIHSTGIDRDNDGSFDDGAGAYSLDGLFSSTSLQFKK